MNKIKDKLSTLNSLFSLAGIVILVTLHFSDLSKINAIQDQKQQFFVNDLEDVKVELKEQRQEIKSILKIVSRLEAIT